MSQTIPERPATGDSFIRQADGTLARSVAEETPPTSAKPARKTPVKPAVKED